MAEAVTVNSDSEDDSALSDDGIGLNLSKKEWEILAGNGWLTDKVRLNSPHASFIRAEKLKLLVYPSVALRHPNLGRYNMSCHGQG